MATLNTDQKTLANNPRATLRAWERYHDIVRTAYNSFPKPCVIDPDSMSPMTFETRIRDAIRGAIAFDYPRTFAEGEALADWWSTVRVRSSIHPPRVVISRREVKGLPPLEAKEVGGPNKLEFASLELHEWNAFIVLVNSGRLSGPIIVKSALNKPYDSEIPPNVQLLPRPDGSIIIL